MDDKQTHLSATEAQGGQKTNTVRYVLGISLVAIVVLLAILLISYR